MGCRLRVLINKKKFKELSEEEKADVLEEAIYLNKILGGRKFYRANLNDIESIKEEYRDLLFLEEDLEEIDRILEIILDEDKKDKLMFLITNKVERIIADIILGGEDFYLKQELIKLKTDCQEEEKDWIDVMALLEELMKGGSSENRNRRQGTPQRN